MKKILSTVTSVQDLYKNYLNGGEPGWFAFVRGEQKFYEWKDSWVEIVFTDTIVITSWLQQFEDGIYNITDNSTDTPTGLAGTLKLIVFTDYVGKQIKVVQSGDKAYYLVNGEVFLLWSVTTIQAECTVPHTNNIPEYKGSLPAVKTVAQLYLDYPMGGEFGWYAFVVENKTFAFWDVDLEIWSLLASGVLQNLVAGSNITIDWSDPLNPIISAAASKLTAQQVADQIDMFDEATSITTDTYITLGSKKKAKTSVFYNFFKSAYDQLYAAVTHSHAYNSLTGLPTLFSGNYNDLSGKPTIPSPQVQSDWNAVSGMGAILNKPDISTPTMPETVPTAIAVGGVAAGTNLKGKTAIEILDTMLYPELWPTLIDPSSTFTITPNDTYQEVGASITISIYHDFKRGSISPAYGTSGFRSGELIDYTETGTVGSYTVVLGVQSWTSKANYAAGEQPLGSKGTKYDSPLAAGSTSVITRIITGVYPVYANTSTITTLTKQALQAHGSDIIISLVGEDGVNKQTVQIPQAWGTIGTLQQYNTLSASWDNIDLATFTKTSIVIGGVNYWQYVYNGSTIGARQIKFKL
jgi:hypothetical protein